MPRTQTAPLLRFIRDLKQTEESRTASDRELLRRFIDAHDETAFRAIACRHGGMVFRVCLRVLQREQDAEDAFQATFVALAQRATVVERRDSLGSWLFGVAYRLACKMKRGLARRRAHEQKAVERVLPDPLAELSVREAQDFVDAEIERLPDKYRGPFVLCCLEGATRDEAARQLGLTLSAVKKRIATGRELLRRRLSRRGLTLTAGLLASVLAEARVSAAVSSLALDSTVKAATAVAAGGAAASVVWARAAVLTEGMVRTMLLAKIKTVAAILLVLGCAWSAALMHVRSGVAADDRGKPVSAQAGVPGAGDAGAASRTPSAPVWRMSPVLQGHGGPVYKVTFSPDGKWLASGSRDKSVILWNLARGKPAHTLTHSGSIKSIAFSPDGKTMVTASGLDLLNEDYEIKFWDPESGKEKAVLKAKYPIHHLSFSRDGRILVCSSSPMDHTRANGGEVVFWDAAKRTKIASLDLEDVAYAVLSNDMKKLAISTLLGTVKLLHVNEKFAATREETLVQGGAICVLAISADGKTLAVAAAGGWEAKEPRPVSLWDLQSGESLKAFDQREISPSSLAFAPDGKTLAVAGWMITEIGSAKKLTAQIRFWDLVAGEEKQALGQKLPPVTSLAFAPDGRRLALGLLHKEAVNGDGFDGNETGGVVLCELKGGKR